MSQSLICCRRYLTVALMTLLLSLPLNAFAQDSTELLLELVPPDGAPIRLSRTDLEALPQLSFETTTGWTESSALYTGPRLIDVLKLAGLDGRPVLATAANDYKVTLTPDLIGPDYPIVAIRVDDKPFSLRELGPLWIIYPYDLAADYRTENVFAASIWQLVRISPAAQ